MSLSHVDNYNKNTFDDLMRAAGALKTPISNICCVAKVTDTHTPTALYPLSLSLSALDSQQSKIVFIMKMGNEAHVQFTTAGVVHAAADIRRFALPITQQTFEIS
jgi:hypothetical protein